MTDETRTPTDDGETGAGVAGSRRDLLRATGGAVAAGGLLGGAGVVGAQENGTATTAGDGGGEGGGDTALARAAIRSDAPTFQQEGFNGLFLQIERTDATTREPDVSGCPFVEGDQPVATFNAYLITRIDDANRSEQVAVYANADTTEIAPGKLFVVNSAQECGGAGGLTQLRLERVGAAQINPDVAADNGTADGGTTSGSIPGFGVTTALGGLVGAGAAAYRARRDGGED
jgi:hypothetical protein